MRAGHRWAGATGCADQFRGGESGETRNVAARRRTRPATALPRKSDLRSPDGNGGRPDRAGKPTGCDSTSGRDPTSRCGSTIHSGPTIRRDATRRRVSTIGHATTTRRCRSRRRARSCVRGRSRSIGSRRTGCANCRPDVLCCVTSLPCARTPSSSSARPLQGCCRMPHASRRLAAAEWPRSR